MRSTLPAGHPGAEEIRPVGKRSILFILQLPPPVHGASLMGEQVRGMPGLGERFETEFLRLSTGSKGRVWKPSFWRDLLRLYGAVRRALLKRRFDLVYITPCASGLAFYKDYFVCLLARGKARRVLYHFHNKGLARNRFAPGWVKRSFLRGVGVILLSPRLKSDLAEYACDTRIHCVPNGIDPLPPAPAPARTDGRVSMLFLSNMIRSKGVFVLLEACARLRARGVEFLCRFAGPWYEIREEEFRARVQALGLDRYVEHLGPVYGSDKAGAMAAADLFAFPTFYPDECFPLVLLEAMSAGLPVVATEEGAIPDIVEDGVEGRVVPREDPERLASALESLIADGELRARMGAAARRKFESRFTRPVFERELLRVLECETA